MDLAEALQDMDAVLVSGPKWERIEAVIQAAEAMVEGWFDWNDAPDATGLVEAVDALQTAREVE